MLWLREGFKGLVEKGLLNGLIENLVLRCIERGVIAGNDGFIEVETELDGRVDHINVPA